MFLQAYNYLKAIGNDISPSEEDVMGENYTTASIKLTCLWLFLLITPSDDALLGFFYQVFLNQTFLFKIQTNI